MLNKFFSLICATLLVFSASAAPVAPKVELAKKVPVAVEQMQTVQLEQAQTLNLNQLSATPAVKVINQEAKASAVKPAARKLATAEPIVVIIDGTPSIQPAGDVQAITVIGKDNMVYAWGVKTTSLEAGKTYAFTDINTDYTYRCSQDYFSTFEDPTDATFSIDAENNITASIVTESGTYMVYTNDPTLPQDSIVTAVDWYYDDYYYDVYVYAENTTYIFELLESTGGLTYGTTYTYADMYADWVCTLDGGGYPLVKSTDATLTVTKDEAGLIHIAATMVLEGVTHVISYDEKPFVPSGVQIPLNGTELSGGYNSWYYMYVYTAKVGENTVQLAFDATAEQATYTKDQLITDYCVYYSDDYSTYVEFVKAASDFTVTTTETTKTLAGSVYATNGDEYILNLVYEKPAPLDPTNLNDINATVKANKVLRNGQLIIRQGGKAYNVLGAKIK